MGLLSGISSIPVVGGIAGQALSGAGFGPAPNAWDAEAATKPVMDNAQGIYDKSTAWAAGALGNGPKINPVQAQTIATPGTINAQTLATPNAVTADQITAPGAVTAASVGVSDLVGGQQAADLRAKQLQQADVAANSPSAAVAQMRAAGAQIQGQQAAMAAASRGAGRAAARRDAMLATGNLGLQAANQTSALAASENAAKQQAYAQTLAGVRSGDVSGANAQAQVGVANQQAGLAAQTTTGQQALAAAQANQAANLQAQTTTGAQGLAAGQANQAANLQAQQFTAGNTLQAGQANQTANLAAQQYTAGNNINAWQGQQQAAANFLNTGNNAVGQQNQANANWANYATGQNTLNQKQNAGAASTITSLVGLSDSRSKEDVARFGENSGGGWMGKLSGMFSGGGKQPDNGGATTNPIEQLRSQGFFDRKPPSASPLPAMPPTQQTQDPWGQHDLSSSLSLGGGAPLPQAGGDMGMVPPLGLSPWTSDEETKQAVAQMGDDDLIDWANHTDLATYRYKPGVADGGATPQVGVSSAQKLERTGPLGRLMVSEGPDGLKRVDYPKLAYAKATAALAKANQNEDLYGQLLRDAQIANQRNNRKGA